MVNKQWRDLPKVLIVDDDERLAKLLARHLSNWGFSPSIALDGSKIDDLFERDLHHLLLLDINLPGESGWQILERLRAARFSIPVLLMTGFPEEDALCRSIEMGASGFLTKPFNPDELLLKINSIFGGHDKKTLHLKQTFLI